jgi:hypothetical protein
MHWKTRTLAAVGEHGLQPAAALNVGRLIPQAERPDEARATGRVGMTLRIR